MQRRQGPPSPATLAYGARLVAAGDSALYTVRAVTGSINAFGAREYASPATREILEVSLEAESAAGRIAQLAADLDIEPPPDRYAQLHSAIAASVALLESTTATYGKAANLCFTGRARCADVLGRAGGILLRSMLSYTDARNRAACLLDADGVRVPDLRPWR